MREKFLPQKGEAPGIRQEVSSEPAEKLPKEKPLEENQPCPEPESAIKKVIGPETDERKQKIKRALAETFREQESEYFFSTKGFLKELKKVELEKSPREIEIINLVNKETNRLLEKYGLPKFDIPPKNIHFLEEKDYCKFWAEAKGVKEEEFEKEESAPILVCGGSYDPFSQAVLLNKEQRDTDLCLATTLYHELVHFKTFQTVRALPVEGEAELQRIGLKWVSESGEAVHFKNLNEGLTQELTKRFYKEVLKNHSLFKKEVEKIEKKITEKRAVIEDRLNEEGQSIDDVFEIKTKITQEGLINDEYFTFGHVRERRILNSLTDKLYSRNKEKFKDREEVFDLFAKSAFTGKLSWGRLVNQTFGRGTFKKLAQLDKNPEELEKFVKGL